MKSASARSQALNPICHGPFQRVLAKMKTPPTLHDGWIQRRRSKEMTKLMISDMNDDDATTKQIIIIININSDNNK